MYHLYIRANQMRCCIPLRPEPNRASLTYPSHLTRANKRISYKPLILAPIRGRVTYPSHQSKLQEVLYDTYTRGCVTYKALIHVPEPVHTVHHFPLWLTCGLYKDYGLTDILIYTCMQKALTSFTFIAGFCVFGLHILTSQFIISCLRLPSAYASLSFRNSHTLSMISKHVIGSLFIHTWPPVWYETRWWKQNIHVPVTVDSMETENGKSWIILKVEASYKNN